MLYERSQRANEPLSQWLWVHRNYVISTITCCGQHFRRLIIKHYL